MNNARSNVKAQVSEAIVFNNSKVLLVQERKASAHGLWNYPGGLVEDGETLEEAAIREMNEELGVDLVDARFIKAYPIITPRGELEINIFTGTLLGDITLKNDDVMDYRWFSIHELESDKEILRGGDLIIRQAKDVLGG